MQDIKVFKQKDLILNVNPSYDPLELDLDEWEFFLDKLCLNREYQKEAIKTAIIYFASGKYKTIEDLVEENYKKNEELQSKYSTLSEYKKKIQISNKLFGNIDLSTGAGKSYVIYGIAQIMLGLGLVDKVLVLCPSITIEDGLTEKFTELSGNADLKDAIPESAKFKNPRIVNANSTIKAGDICVENIHAVYANTGSSIDDSLIWDKQRVLVLNDESHHIFNKVEGRGEEVKNLKKWKEFLLNTNYDFKYILGLTGTAYHNNEYFNDVIYRYSLREGIEDRIVKNIDYKMEDDNGGGDNEKFQKIYINHDDNIKKYRKVKPLTILITKDIGKANILADDLIDFLSDKESLPREDAEKKILIVTSHKDHKPNLLKLKTVDNHDNPVEWIVSVSMLTEGWDVKNVFQIVPWEDRAFNSKLLIAQVLGRGLRVPEAYNNIQPIVTVFNHDSWSKNIKGLIDEVLEIETRLYSNPLLDEDKFDRAKYHFDVYNLDYTKQEVEVTHNQENKTFNYTEAEQKGISLEAQTIVADKEAKYVNVLTGQSKEKNYVIESETTTVDEVVDKIYDNFRDREWEGTVLQLGEDKYTKNNLPPREKIVNIIKISMKNRGIKGDKIIEKNVQKIYSSFSTLLRKKGKTVVSESKVNEPYVISTKSASKESLGIGNLKRGHSVFYTNNFDEELLAEDQLNIMNEIESDLSLPRSAPMKEDEYYFKTPFDLVFTKGEPERTFIEKLCKKDIIKLGLIDAWIKSRDTGFYSIEYSLKYGGKDSKTRRHALKTFNPDFLIKATKDDKEYILVVEIKADKDDCAENKAKYKYGKRHFEALNAKLKENNINQEYIFHFLSPNGYTQFFDYLKNGTLFESQDIFRCELENLLEED
ncbi:DEAD/DEAH box helicase family protein [Arcobacter sp. 15-2]|uniref:DEAD/DEAH box helicase family protein n=1 Tax=Arcobacter sp. 15-2 TaxID=3374109 RepID=UPI00399CDF6F